MIVKVSAAQMRFIQIKQKLAVENPLYYDLFKF